MAGFLILPWATLLLRHLFGILPSNRGVDASEYTGPSGIRCCDYFARDLAFLRPNPGWQNLLVILVHWWLQTERIIREERVLVSDPVYPRYVEKVRFGCRRGGSGERYEQNAIKT